MISTEDSIIRLIIALILGGLIGYERQAQSKSAGLRTHTLVCVGSCLCMIISINIAMDYYFTFGYNTTPNGLRPKSYRVSVSSVPVRSWPIRRTAASAA